MGAAMGAEVSKVDRTVTLHTGGQIGVRSADNPDSLRGEGLDYVVFDEVAFVKEAAWAEAIRPALSDRKGRALFISTPKGRNWFWRLWQAGQADGDEWAAWQFATVDNPYIDPAEVEAARTQLPERVFRQEYLAEFIDDGAGVFRRVMDCTGAVEIDAALPGHNYVIGVDWAKTNDFTVLTVLDIDTREVVHIDRFNQIDYAVQRGRLQGLAGRFNPTVIIAERNSIGEPNIEMLQRAGLPVQGFTTTNASKQAIIEGLVVAFENGDISIPADPDLIAELQAYEMGRRPGGAVVYNAPAGLHDDMVMSLALAWSGVVTHLPALL